jgi:hypothetical protein
MRLSPSWLKMAAASPLTLCMLQVGRRRSAMAAVSAAIMAKLG